MFGTGSKPLQNSVLFMYSDIFMEKDGVVGDINSIKSLTFVWLLANQDLQKRHSQ